MRLLGRSLVLVPVALAWLLASACGSPSSEPASSAGPAAAPRAEPSAAAGDVILVTIDTLRADALGFMGNTAAATPSLDRLAAEGRVFSRAYAHHVVTLPSHANILTGLYPYQHGVRENSGFKLAADVPTLATRLAAAGWATGAFVGAFPLDSRFGLDRGFEVYDDRYPKGSDRDKFVPPERRGDEVVSLAATWWRENEGRSRFLWVHVYDPHAPYDPPSPFAERFPERPYLGEVAATDAHLAPLFELARQAERPLVIVTADHGEALGEHGELTHGLFGYEATLRVPLVVWGRGISPGVDERLAGHVDLAPTILEAVGMRPAPELAGRSLLQAAVDGERRLYFEALTTFFNRGWAPLRGVVSGDGTDGNLEKMIELPLPELYDLAADPGEATNLFSAARPRFDRLRGALTESAWPPERQESFSAEETRMLRSLGYLSSTSERRGGFSAADDPKSLVEVDRDLHRSIAAYSRGDLEGAVELSRRVLERRADMAPSYELLALSLRQLERPREAIAVLEAALERGLADESMVRQLGLTYAENGLARKAVEVLSPFAASDDLEMLAALGIALSDAGSHSEALEVLRRGERLDATDPRILERLGVVTLRLGEVEAAVGYLERALELNDALPFSWNTLGVAQAYRSRPEAAIEAWERALELDARQWDALYNLGMTAARIGDRERARRALARYIAEAPPQRFAGDIATARRTLAGLGS